jgi:hypothetical protein
MQVPLTLAVKNELDKLSRYCGSNYGYRYPSTSYYRPSYSSGYSTGGTGGFSLASLIGTVNKFR